MNEIKTGGPAFPVTDNDGARCNEGMTLRDYFAAKAMQGLLSDPTMNGYPSDFAKQAYDYADAMIYARDKK